MGFAKSDHGQQLFSLLDRLGMSLVDWAEHDIIQQRYLMAAHEERNRRENEEREKQKRRAR